MEASLWRCVLIAAALTAGALLAMYPESDRGVAGFWWGVDTLLLLMAIRGRAWARTVLMLTTAFGAALFVVAGAGQLSAEPRYFERGIALTVAAVLLIQSRRASTESAL